MIKPMLAVLYPGEVKPLFDTGKYFAEPKIDGARGMSVGKRIYARSGIEYTSNFPELVQELPDNMSFDGEIWCGSWGQTETRIHSAKPLDSPEAVYFVFTILELNGINLTHLSEVERKQLLRKNFAETKHIRILPDSEDGEKLFKLAKAQKMEGIMAKLKTGTYHPGMRSDTWLKVKLWQHEVFLIVGATRGEGYRINVIGSLILADAKLNYVGNCSGFDDKFLFSIEDRLHKTTQIPVNNFPSSKIREVKFFCEPTVRVKVRFLEKGNLLRFPVFEGLVE